jgi:chromosome segregation ATPase
LDAVEDFKTRIASFYATSKKQSSKIAALEKELSCVRRENGELSRDISKAKVLENEHKGLKLRVKDAERHTEAAVTLAERAKDDAVRLRERVMELQVTVDRERQGKEDVEQENKQLKAWLDGHKRLVRVFPRYPPGTGLIQNVI